MALFRDENTVLGPQASVEIPNGQSASANYKLQVIEPTTVSVLTPAASKQYGAFICPPAASVANGTVPLGTYQVVGVEACWGTASTSINVNVEKCASGTADGSGTNVLTANINTAQAAATPVIGALSTNTTLLTLNATDRLNVVTNAGTAGSIANLTVLIYMARVS